MASHVFKFSIRFTSLLLVLLLYDRTPSDVLVIVAASALFFLGEHIADRYHEWFVAVGTVILIIVMPVILSIGGFALLMPKLFLTTVYPVTSSAAILSLYDLSENDYDLFKKLDSMALEGNIFYPRTDEHHSLQRFFPIYGQDDLPDTSQDAIARWRDTKLPEELREADMRYLLLEDEWQAWLTEDEYNTLYDPENYVLIYESPPSKPPNYFLLQVQTP